MPARLATHRKFIRKLKFLKLASLGQGFRNEQKLYLLFLLISFDISLQLNLLPYVCGVREGFIDNFLRLLDRKALALIKYLEAKSYVRCL